jgi:hypothetical protein
VRRISLLSAAVVGAWLVVSAPAHAQSASDKASADALFDEAKRLMEAKRFAEACPKLADSQRLDPAVGTLLNLALCYRQNGQTASAWATYREAAAQARTQGQADREELARSEAAALEKELTRLVIEVSPEARAVSGLEIKRDGAVVPPGLWGIPAPVDPGVRSIDVSAPGKKPLHLEAATQGVGGTAKVVIPLLDDAPVAAGPAPTPAPLAPEASPPATTRESGGGGTVQLVSGLVLGGAGAAAIATGTIFGLLSVAHNKAADNNREKAADLDNSVPATKKYAARAESHENDAESARTIGFICVGTGAAALIGGVVLIATRPKGGPEKTAALELIPEFGQDQVGMRFRGAF